MSPTPCRYPSAWSPSRARTRSPRAAQTASRTPTSRTCAASQTCPRLGASRPIEKPPTPPPSESSSSRATRPRPEPRPAAGKEGRPPSSSRPTAATTRKLRRWRAIKMLGQGTFSRVMLATSQMPVSDDEDEPLSSTSGLLTPEPQARYDRRNARRRQGVRARPPRAAHPRTASR